MSVALFATLALASSWVDITGGLPPNDDFSAIAWGYSPDDLFVGTVGGYVYRSTDGGETYDLVLWPMDADPVIDPRQMSLKGADMPNYGNGAVRGRDPRDRQGKVNEAADLAGEAREHGRAASTPLLGMLSREAGRDRGTVIVIERCFGFLYVATPEAVWRSGDNGLRWDRLSPALVGAGNDIDWFTCDRDRPGRLVVSTTVGLLESVDGGESFFDLMPAFPHSRTVNGVMFDRGLLWILAADAAWRERPKREGGGYARVCQLRGDSRDSDLIRWYWGTGSDARPIIYAVTEDGIVVCSDGKLQRFRGDPMNHQPARFVSVDFTTTGHLYLASEHFVYETRDSGDHFTEIFAPPTTRSVRKLAMHPEEPDHLLVMTGSQIYRRLSDEQAARRAQAPAQDAEPRLQQLIAGAPLGDVVRVALERNELEPRQTAAQQTDVAVRGLMPHVRLFVTRHERTGDGWLTDHWVVGRDIGSAYRSAPTVWGAFFTWDLANVVSDEYTTGQHWADVARLRQKFTYRVQDRYLQWLQACMALMRAPLSARQRLYHELKRREAASYLNELTGGQFASFEPTEPFNPLGGS